MRRGFAHTYGNGNGNCNSYGYGHSNSYRDSDRVGYSYSYGNRDRDANVYSPAEEYADAETASDTTASSLVRNANWNMLRRELARKAREFPA